MKKLLQGEALQKRAKELGIDTELYDDLNRYFCKCLERKGNYDDARVQFLAQVEKEKAVVIETGGEAKNHTGEFHRFQTYRRANGEQKFSEQVDSMAKKVLEENKGAKPMEESKGPIIKPRKGRKRK